MADPETGADKFGKYPAGLKPPTDVHFDWKKMLGVPDAVQSEIDKQSITPPSSTD